MPIRIRAAKVKDVNEITTLFKETIKHINSQHYSADQIVHWMSSADDLPKWKKRIQEFYFLLAEYDEKIVGFAYLNNGNYFDGLFVHHQTQGMGIASLLSDAIETKIKADGFKSVHSDVSITAKPFFEKRGYTIEYLQEKPYRGMIFANYIVSKNL